MVLSTLRKYEPYFPAAPVERASPLQPIDLKDVNERLTKVVVATIQEIVADNQMRMKGYAKNPSLLDRGVFYANHYYKALRTTKHNPQRLKEWEASADFFNYDIIPDSFVIKQDPKLNSYAKQFFALAQGKKPSEAIKAIKEGVTFLDCVRTCFVSYLTALNEVLGDEKFDMIFSTDSSTPLTITNRISSIAHFVNVEKTDIRPVKGDIVAFLNDAEYLSKHPHGNYAGHMTICIDDTEGNKKFTTLGLDASGMTMDEIKERMRLDYNAKPDDFSFDKRLEEQYFAGLSPFRVMQAKQLKDNVIKKADFKPENFVQAAIRFEVDRIAQLIQASNDEACDLVEQWAGQEVITR